METFTECQWFAQCHNISVATVEHPTLGDVEICQSHCDWLTENYSPTKMVPPMVARSLARFIKDGGSL